MVTGAAVVLALYFRVGSLAFGHYFQALLLYTAIVVALAAVVYRVVGLYRGIWRYASVNDLIQLAKAVTLVIVGSLVILFLINRLAPIPRSVPMIQWFITIVFLGGSRFAYRVLKDRKLKTLFRASAAGRIPVILIGAGDKAELFIRSVQQSVGGSYRVVGVVALKPARVGRDIRGVPVIGSLADLESCVVRTIRVADRPQRAILTVAAEEMNGPKVARLVERCDRLGLPLSRLPKLTDFRDAGEKIEPRPIAIEDLLGRPQVTLDRDAIARLIDGKRVLITGAGGSIGSELTRQIARLNPDRLTLFESSEFNLYAIDGEIRALDRPPPVDAVIGDVRDRSAVDRAFEMVCPEVVFHAAALKHVPLVEGNPFEGVLTNIVGTANVADAARAFQSEAMILISTDKAVRPANVMGATKRIAESYCQALDVAGRGNGKSGTRFMTVRFGNVLGSSGSVVPLFQRQLLAGGPLTVTHPDMRRYFMTIREAVELVIHASAFGLDQQNGRGTIFVLDMGQPVRIVDLARQMIRLAGFRPDTDIPITFTGLRPGEKLFEEILDPAETPLPAPVGGLFVASPRIVQQEILHRAIGQLRDAVENRNVEKMKAILTNIVPGYGAQPVVMDFSAKER